MEESEIIRWIGNLFNKTLRIRLGCIMEDYEKYKGKSIRNFNTIQKRDALLISVERVLWNADTEQMKTMCRHCKKYEECQSTGYGRKLLARRQLTCLVRGEECINGLVDWMYEVSKEQNNGQHDD